ncbi:hypothetical protein BU23DRAFT_659412 [Bimuria novae-zelandiae CBS 107.79]|uniref:Uncharacterized protein n=1 Tax=Bimuria novae-zelandiae CBS 107.79 TaxID=1447943 RepID=A0A6A5USE0_9PLEO|nr:hypothetical protein BU23DRAFT_659412 [Bimuria novae-zelandiae CBS 107.79]
MTRPEGTQWKDGPGMHYSTTNWIKSSLRAMGNGNWLLTFVIIGNILCQVFIISASALFTREKGYISTDTTLNTTIELRRLPVVTEDGGSFLAQTRNWSRSDDKRSFSSVDLERIFNLELFPSLYWTEDSAWLYAATNQIVQQGDEPAWSKQGSYIGNFTSYSTPFEYELGLFPFCANISGTVINGAKRNDWSGDQPGRFPYRFSQWPINFTTTWIQGAARSDFFARDNVSQNYTLKTYDERLFPSTWGCAGDTDTRLNLSMFTEIPKLQSVSCEPAIEVANARATVSQDGNVESFEILEDPKPLDDLWKDVFISYTRNNSDAGYSPGDRSKVDRNIISRQVNESATVAHRLHSTVTASNSSRPFSRRLKSASKRPTKTSHGASTNYTPTRAKAITRPTLSATATRPWT